MNFQTENIPAIIFSMSALIVLLALFLWALKHRVQKALKTKRDNLSKKSVTEWISDLSAEKDLLEKKIQSGKYIFAKLSSSHAATKTTVSQIQVGLPPPNFKYTDDEELKEAVRTCRVEQYEVIKTGRAATSLSRWSWFGSEADGAMLIKTYNKLLIGAFNAEFDIIRSKMRHSTGQAAIKKLESSLKALEKLAETVNVRISPEYILLKEKEINVWHSYLVRKNNEKEEAKQQRALLREQNKILGRASDDADEDEYDEELNAQIEFCSEELVKAKLMAENLAGDELANLELKIREIEEEKAKVTAKFDRAQSQAQITRAGYVYVISNIGSFGEGICKIGMTRRLEPMDRVVELGDASVPFRFDVHTLAFVEDAPRLEKNLHSLFHDRRVNVENHRKEFFKVSPSEVKTAMEGLGVKSSWYFDCDAKEYRESVLLIASKEEAKEARQAALITLPEDI
ncbi:DUF4041 domain-containing protein [Gilvimarinus sp. 1_MG-2023]|uniref:DUF4041 domain-containing protein n=1 Tax=Gilvimarinus sp. 1_MG-2023 TaxID=3062638 RepID=UPI0026E2173E|nr:DUF4041 domain-containing protein [Gilvimarinus sp. 1_MG-2023]MDO6746177.1 DUF4041 domain-containing protein [Gilvimarinus sp. 1_MG-2023]